MTYDINQNNTNNSTHHAENLVAQILSRSLNIPSKKILAVMNLINEGATVPFIARYRKERTGYLDERQIRDIQEHWKATEKLEKRRASLLDKLEEFGVLTQALKQALLAAKDLSVLEEIYAPYKQKKKTRADVAKEKGLEPLARKIQRMSERDWSKVAYEYVSPKLGVENFQEALQGARDILAREVSQNLELRDKLSQDFFYYGRLKAKSKEKLDDLRSSVYRDYQDFSSSLSRLKPHWVLALFRGEKEKKLKLTMDTDSEKTMRIMISHLKPRNSQMDLVVKDSWKRILEPSIVRELRKKILESSQEKSRIVFAKNLKNLLLQPPLIDTRVLGIDPGLRTGTKITAVDESGKLLDYLTIRQNNRQDSLEALNKIITRHKIQLVAIGNGTGSQEIQDFMPDLIQNNPGLAYTIVPEDGASVYSASEVARMEFPQLDVTIRGAISIARRIQDPLSELVKIDPSSLGVGQYQHDADPSKLTLELDQVVESVVNSVGVNLRSASASLLSHVSGLSKDLAQKILKYRDENGGFSSRKELLKVPGLGPKTFEQCAGFLRVPQSVEPLDNSWVHPESYSLARLILKAQSLEKDLESLAKEKGIGMRALQEIKIELEKPGRDPREDYPAPLIQEGVKKFEDLYEGIELQGVVRNVVDFGAFVDLGMKENGLVHISQMSDEFVNDPHSILAVGDTRKFRVLSIDQQRRRIELSLKTVT